MLDMEPVLASLKSIWVCILSAATVTVYFHIKHREPIMTPVHQEVAKPVQTVATPAPRVEKGEIVVVPFNGGEVGSRLQETPRQDGNLQKRWNN